MNNTRNKIRSACLGSLFLALSCGAVADQDPDLRGSLCQVGAQCDPAGGNCVTLQGTIAAGTPYVYGFNGMYQDANGQNHHLVCGAIGETSYSFSVPSGIAVQFGVIFGPGMTNPAICNNGASFPIDGNTKVAYTYTANPNACTVTNVE